MRVIHNNYAATTYGESSIAISDPTGRQVFQTNDRPNGLDNEKALVNFLKKWIKEYQKGQVA